MHTNNIYQHVASYAPTAWRRKIEQQHPPIWHERRRTSREPDGRAARNRKGGRRIRPAVAVEFSQGCGRDRRRRSVGNPRVGSKHHKYFSSSECRTESSPRSNNSTTSIFLRLTLMSGHLLQIRPVWGRRAPLRHATRAFVGWD